MGLAAAFKRQFARVLVYVSVAAPLQALLGQTLACLMPVMKTAFPPLLHSKKKEKRKRGRQVSEKALEGLSLL